MNRHFFVAHGVQPFYGHRPNLPGLPQFTSKVCAPVGVRLFATYGYVLQFFACILDNLLLSYCATRTLLTIVSGMTLKRIGFNVASGVQCDILLNCTINIRTGLN